MVSEVQRGGFNEATCLLYRKGKPLLLNFIFVLVSAFNSCPSVLLTCMCGEHLICDLSFRATSFSDPFYGKSGKSGKYGKDGKSGWPGMDGKDLSPVSSGTHGCIDCVIGECHKCLCNAALKWGNKGVAYVVDPNNKARNQYLVCEGTRITCHPCPKGRFIVVLALSRATLLVAGIFVRLDRFLGTCWSVCSTYQF